MTFGKTGVRAGVLEWNADGAADVSEICTAINLAEALLAEPGSPGAAEDLEAQIAFSEAELELERAEFGADS